MKERGESKQREAGLRSCFLNSERSEHTVVQRRKNHQRGKGQRFRVRVVIDGKRFLSKSNDWWKEISKGIGRDGR